MLCLPFHSYLIKLHVTFFFPCVLALCPAYLTLRTSTFLFPFQLDSRSSNTKLLLTFASSILTCWHFFVFLSFYLIFCSHLPASAGWTGMSTITNGGVMEPTQGLNGSMLASQPGMGATGYPTHWWVGKGGSVINHQSLIGCTVALWGCDKIASVCGRTLFWDVEPNGEGWRQRRCKWGLNRGGEGWGWACNGSQGDLTHTGIYTPCGRQDWPWTRALTIFKLTVNEYKL